jgi:hypothetical protein
MSVLDDIKGSKELYITCPCCDEEFRATKGVFFDALGPLPGAAQAILTKRQEELAAGQKAFANKKSNIGKAEVTAKAVNVGKVVEKIATVLPGFAALPGDCRSLFEPIDFIIFEGLSAKGSVDAIHFTELKSGGGKLNGHQQQIRVLPASVREIELPVGVPSSGAARAAGGRSWQDERGQFRPK